MITACPILAVKGEEGTAKWNPLVGDAGPYISPRPLRQRGTAAAATPQRDSAAGLYTGGDAYDVSNILSQAEAEPPGRRRRQRPQEPQSGGRAKRRRRASPPAASPRQGMQRREAAVGDSSDAVRRLLFEAGSLPRRAARGEGAQQGGGGGGAAAAGAHMLQRLASPQEMARVENAIFRTPPAKRPGWELLSRLRRAEE